MAIDKLENDLKAGKLNSIYLLYGAETYLLETTLKKIKKIFGKTIEGINYVKIDETNSNELIADLETPAFGFEKKLVIAKNTGLLKKEGKKKNIILEENIKKVSKYINENADDIKDNVILIFIEQEVDKNELYKVLEKNGEVYNFELEKLPQLIKRIKGICGAYKVNIDDNTAKYFIECCGTSMQDLVNEIRKLIEYVGENGTIKKQVIDLLSIKQLESVIFDLTDNLGNKNVIKALEVLKNLIYSKEPIQKILITLYNHFKKLYIVKLSEKYNKNLAESLNLKPNQMFLTTKYKNQSKYFSEQELRTILNELISLDTNYKSGLIDLEIGLESILCRYCSK